MLSADVRRDQTVWLVLPTYNEAENIERMLRAANHELARAVDDWHILVVDDGSPDGTGQMADALAEKNPSIEVMHRTTKEGLGRAYLAGFAYALERGADLLIEMDADFSHDPRDLPRLIAETQHADLVLGSRYTEGGAVVDWPLPRRCLSRAGSWYARRMLGVRTRDLTGGFKCFRQETLHAIRYLDTHAEGYGFQIELTYRAVQAGLHVVEIPIVFRDRQAGTSKMNAAIALEAMWKVPALRFRARRRRLATVPLGMSPQHSDRGLVVGPE